MNIGTATSVSGVKIRLSSERWNHIIISHPEIDLAGVSDIFNTIKNPEAVLQGDAGELLAVQQSHGRKYWLVVVYKELNTKDGFVITAYITTDKRWLFKRKIIWSKN